MNQVFICGTYFQVYVSILKIIYSKHKNAKNLLVLNDHTPGIENIISALQENNFFDHYVVVPFLQIESRAKKELTFLEKVFSRNNNVIQSVELNSTIRDYDHFLAGSEFNLYYNSGFPSAYFILKYPANYFRIIEDGSRNYALRTSTLKYYKRKYILKTFIGDGFDSSVKEINVQYPERLDSRIRSKATTLYLKDMQSRLSPEDQKRILSVFMRGFSVNVSGAKKLLLITQPLSEDKLISEEYKIAMYSAILERYKDDYQLFVKPHPREITNYGQTIQFPFVEIPRAFPMEMFELMENITFDVGVTIYSSALDNSTVVNNKIVLGREYVKELLPGRKLL